MRFAACGRACGRKRRRRLTQGVPRFARSESFRLLAVSHVGSSRPKCLHLVLLSRMPGLSNQPLNRPWRVTPGNSPSRSSGAGLKPRWLIIWRDLGAHGDQKSMILSRELALSDSTCSRPAPLYCCSPKYDQRRASSSCE